ncbi:hypothetical protein [Changpingibacter yushuensis]|uniref:hypothetical protein n=1 Tax=Changpingibacter yushuensis TaxID=2758440 RepID=UPI0015F5B1BB|nr:hypothetical protein [Changpingibacter yushuensis]
MNPKEAEGASLVEILQDITEMVEKARSVPMSASVMVNRAELLDLLSSAKDMVPSQIVRADGLLAQASTVTEDAKIRAEQIQQRAEDDADTIIQEAREQASRLVSQDSVTIAAKAQAQRIVDDAMSQAEKLRRGADSYSDTALLALQDQLSEMGNAIDGLSQGVQGQIDSVLGQIAAGRNVIAERQDEEEEQEESWT